MKSRLNLTIEDSLLKRMKSYAEKQRTSVSDLVENYFRQVTKPSNGESFVDLVDKLEPSNVDKKANLKEIYYLDKNNGN